MQLRRVSILCIAVLISHILIGCSTNPKEPGRYYNKANGFSIKFPDAWKEQKSPMGIIITFGNPENSTRVGVQKQKISPQQTLTDCIQYMESNIAGNGGKIFNKGETVIDDSNAYWILCDLNSESLLAYYIKKEDYIYSILGSAYKNDFSEDEIRKIALSFRFE